MRSRMGCERVRGRLDRFADRALDPVEEALDRGHLEACGPCRVESERRLEFQGQIRDSLRGEEAGLERAIEDLLAGGRGVSSARRFRGMRGQSSLSLATAAAAIVILIGIADRVGGLPRFGPRGACVPHLEFALPQELQGVSGWLGTEADPR